MFLSKRLRTVFAFEFFNVVMNDAHVLPEMIISSVAFIAKRTVVANFFDMSIFNVYPHETLFLEFISTQILK